MPRGVIHAAADPVQRNNVILSFVRLFGSLAKEEGSTFPPAHVSHVKHGFEHAS